MAGSPRRRCGGWWGSSCYSLGWTGRYPGWSNDKNQSLRMRRRKLFVTLVVFSALLTCAFAVRQLLETPGSFPRIRRTTFARITPGATLQEVTAVLGAPGDYSTMETEPARGDLQPGDFVGTGNPWSPKTLKWTCDSAEVRVSFDREDKVETAMYFPRRPSATKGGTLSEFVRRVRRQWEEWFP
jgi:hypothetical protein